MAKRPTLKDVAAEAGVSLATVNRVIAADPKVRKDTAIRVTEAARAIGYHGYNLLIHQVKQSLPLVRLGFVLYKERQCLKQHLSPKDIVDATLFLASDASRMMTGQVLVVDGGVVTTG